VAPRRAALLQDPATIIQGRPFLQGLWPEAVPAVPAPIIDEPRAATEVLP